VQPRIAPHRLRTTTLNESAASSTEQNGTEGQLPRCNPVPPAPDRRAIVKQLTVHWGVKGGGGFSVLNAVWNPDTTDLGRFSRRPTTVRSDMNSTAVRDVAPCSPVQAYGHFGGNYWFHHQDGKLASKHIFSLLGSFLDPYGLKQHASPKRCYSPTRLHGVKTETHIVSALRCFSQNNVTMNCLQ
jgi:hypothetical protein